MSTRLGPWRLERTLGRDLAGTYHAARRGDGERATVYLVSGDLAMRREALSGLLELHRDLVHPGLIRFRSLELDDGDTFLVADAADDALQSLRSGRRPDPGQICPLGAALAAALVAAHDRGLVHGGLDLDTTLWAPGRSPQLLGAGVAALGIEDRAALAHGDVAGLGRLLCALIAGMQPRGSGTGGVGTDERTVELARLLADPGAAISMREAYAMLAAGGLGAMSVATGEPTLDDRRAVRGIAGANDGRFAAPVTAETVDYAPFGSDIGASGAGAAAEPGQAAGQLSRYRILTRLGRGGMGEVLLAEDPALRRGVAIKRIRPGLERDRTYRARLRREAQLAARLNHRAIVQVFDLVTSDNVDHVVMEYVPGPSLHTLLAGGAMAVPEAVRIAIEIADGLAYAHQQGIVHRDLKLENILMGTDGQPKIADFGIARRMAAAADSVAQESLTRDGFVVGTSRAMSPEQVQGHEVDARSDLFSFGVLLYELVTGTSPFAAGGDAQTVLRVLHHRQVPASELVSGVPRALSDLIDHLLEKAPAQRPDSARIVRERLQRVLEDRAPPREEVPVGTAVREVAATAPHGPVDPASSPRRAGTPTPAPGRGERRQVTLVCIELATAGNDELGDPEVLADVLPALRARAEAILARFDGVLISALGHRFVACFGHPRPLEDAAHRAVLAGRALLAAAGELRSHDPVHLRARFTARASVHTGLAVVRGRGAGEELVLGATLDAALRLLHTAGVGDLWLSDSAARLVENDFRLERLAGASDSSSVRRFVGVASGAAGTGEHDRPMVGREHEMQLLLASWRRARQGQGQVALLVGDPGIGKSRLTRELAAVVAADKPRRIVLRGSAHRQRSALEPVAEAIAALIGLGADGGGVAAAPEELAAGTDRLRALTGPDEAEQILHLLGRPARLSPAPPDRARHQLLGGLRDVLVGPSHDAVTLLIVEDLHWLDPSTLDLLALVVQDAASLPLFLLMTTRPGFQPPWPAPTAVTQLRLGRLEAQAIDAVIAHACNDRALPAAERQLIIERSAGVPLYAQELVRAALELGRAGEVPSTLRDALTARLHQLGPVATRVAHVAAVAGREFTAELLVGASGIEREVIEQELERLVAGEIVLRRRGRAREVLYQFAHVLLQQAAYEELLAADRRELHGQLADTLLAAERAGRDPGPELIVHHLAGARRFAEAIASAQRAALRVLARHARVEARDLLRQALIWLEQLPESDERDRTEIGLRMQLAANLISTEGYTSPELEQSCRRAEILCKRHEDLPLPVKHSLWGTRFMRGSPDEVEPFLVWFEQVLERGGSPIERMVSHGVLGTYANARARYDQASQHFESAMALFRPEDHPVVVQSYGGGGGFSSHVVQVGVLWKTGRVAEAWRHARETIALTDALDPYALTSAIAWEMSLYLSTGDVEHTEANAERMLELTTRYEFRYLACSALCGRGWARARRGQGERALADLVTGTEGTKKIGVKVWYPYYLGLYADACIVLGQFDRAERALDEGLELCRTSVDCSNEPELLRLRGQAVLGRDASARGPARAAFTEALAVARQRGARSFALRAATDLAALLHDERRFEEATAVLAPVCGEFPPGLEDPNLAAARNLLAALSAGAA
ncbi:MAG TPA: protein kinase [Kofleriaceae bacterium]|nr:protein kinase [Kofleriaceae bacterium]